MTTSVPFVRTPEPVVRKMLELSEVNPTDVVYDLGSGDGGILIIAAKEFGARAVGIELREDLVEKTREKIRKSGLEKSVKVIQGNFFDVDVSEADVVTLYLLSSVNAELRPKLERELRSGTRVVSYAFEVRGWEPIKKEKMEGYYSSIYLYHWEG